MKFRMWRRSETAAQNPDQEPATVVANGAIWERLRASIRWEPEAGEVLIGIFNGYRERVGRNGAYNVVMIRTTDALYSLTGMNIIDLFATVTVGARVRVVYKGTVLTRNGHHMKVWEAFIQSAREEIA